jgi:hypothetical protein
VLKATRQILEVTAPVISLLVVAGILAGESLVRNPGNRPWSREAFEEAAESIPYRVGEWIGTDVQAPAPAVPPLGATFRQDRRYENFATGWKALISLVYCADPNDVVVYCPKVRYESRGWSESSAIPKKVETRHHIVSSTVHRFVMGDSDQRSCFVSECIVNGIDIQVEMSDIIPEMERDNVFRTLIEGAFPRVESMGELTERP